MDPVHKRGAPQAKLALIKKRYNLYMMAEDVKGFIPAGTSADRRQEICYIFRGIHVSGWMLGMIFSKNDQIKLFI
jgi:hypothetical protein